MKKWMIWGIAVSLKFAMAVETFGGIGLAIYPSEMGVEVAEVVQGAAADRAGLAAGDYLLSVDGISLAGKSLKFDLESLRGMPGQRMELSVLHGSDTLLLFLEREKLMVKTEEECSLFLKSDFDDNLQFLDEVNLFGLNAIVYVKRSAKMQMESQKSMDMRNVFHFDRLNMNFYLPNEGLAKVFLFDANGRLVRAFELEGVVGENQIAWDGKNQPSGNYYIFISQSGKPRYFKGALK